jgi:hypothetical protein
MKCYRHRERDAVGVCACCGKGLCAEPCVRDDLAVGLHCDDACAGRLRKRMGQGSETIAWYWSMLLTIIGGGLLYYGYGYSGLTMNVANMLGMLFFWYGVVLLLQRMSNRASVAKASSKITPSS